MPLRGVWVAAACLAVVLASARPAAAQTDPRDAATAQTLFDEGKKLMLEHRYEQACPKFVESNRLDVGIGTMLFLGACYEKSGATASAWSVFRDAAELAHKLNDAREQVARDYVDRLAPLLFKLTISVPPEVAAIPGLEVRRDGALVAPAAWGSQVPVDPGPHRITADAPDRRAWSGSVDARSTGGTETVTIPRLEPKPHAEPVPVAPSANPDGTGRTQRLVGWVIAGVGVAGGVSVGTLFGLEAKSQNDQANANGRCVDTMCADPGGVDLRHRASTSALVSTVAFVTGGALLAAGTLVVLTAPSAKGGVRVGLGPKAAWLEGTW